jgi:hypothetical protein
MLKSALFSVLLLAGVLQRTPIQLIDNERVTVWDAGWPKGTYTDVSPTMYDQVAVELSDSMMRITSADGKSQTSTLKSGQASFIKKGTVRKEEALSDPARHAILIDVKEPVVTPLENKSGFPKAMPREGAKKVIENARVIVWDYSWTMGKPTPMHFHDKDVVVIYLNNGDLKSTTPDGASVINSYSFGQAKFNARNRTHSEELVKGSQRAIIVELK